MRVAILFDNFGPYHLARLRAASRVVELLAVEVAGRSGEYAWHASDARQAFQRVTLFPGENGRERSSGEIYRLLAGQLVAFRPAVVFVPGWSSRAAFMAMQWCVRAGVPIVTMSESTAWDEQRTGLKEFVKRRIVGLCSAALVGGTPHADYMNQLGVSRDRIFPGYDAVDNDYFSGNAEKLRTETRKADMLKAETSSQPSTNCHPPASSFFLASARFIEKKNLSRLLQAYARYRALASKTEIENQKARIASPRRSPHGGEGDVSSSIIHSPSTPWSLVLLGDGPMRDSLNSQISTLNLHQHVQMPGFKQYPELPAYYGRASAFIHASTTEQWGLVVNEAMASGLPVLVSNCCGCAPDLVQEGVNGFTFDPFNVEEMAQVMFQLSAFEDSRLSAMGDASRRIVSNWGLERFTDGLRQSAECAVRAGPKPAGLFDRMILGMLAGR